MTPQFIEFETTVSSMLPEISAVLTDPVDVSAVLIRLRDRYANKDIPANEAGTGVSALMHLIACVLFMPAGRILLIDEPQLHLHPGAEKLLAHFFRVGTQQPRCRSALPGRRMPGLDELLVAGCGYYAGCYTAAIPAPQSKAF